MPRHIPQALIEQFITEVQPLISKIRDAFSAFCEGSNGLDSLSNIRRMTQQIKDEAWTIGLADFSRVAALQEEVLEDLIGQKSPAPQPELIWATIVSLEHFLVGLLDEETDEQEQFPAAIKSYRRYRELSEEKDAQEIRRLLGDSRPHETDIAAEYPHEGSESGAHLGLAPSDVNAYRQEIADAVQVVLDVLSQEHELDAEELQTIQRSAHAITTRAARAGLREVADIGQAIEGMIDQVTAEGAGLALEQRFLLIHAIEIAGDLVEEGTSCGDIEELVRELTTETAQHADIEEVQAVEAVASETQEDVADRIREEALEELMADLDSNVPAELEEVYREEAEDHIKLIYSALNALQTSPGDLEQLQNVRRSAHTLKGASGAVGLRVITKLSHRMEDLLDRLYETREALTPAILTLLLNTTDRLHDLSFGEYEKESVVGSIVQLYDEFSTTLADQGNAESGASEKLGTQTVPAEEEKRVEKTSPSPKNAGRQPMLRVPLGRIDDVVRTVSELIINRTTFEQRMSDFVRGVDELATILDRIRAVSVEMETKYGVDALGGHLEFARGNFIPKPNFTYVPASGNSNGEFDTLEFDQYTDFHLLSRSVSEVTNDVSTVANEFRTLIGDFDSLLARQDRLSRETQDRLMKVRMVPLASLATRLHRAVRVVASNQQKLVDLMIEGEDTELDKTVLEEIADPLLHLLRNAVDHGVEPPDSRLLRGKPEAAQIRIRAYYQGTQAVLQLSDDGGGLNVERIADAAIRKGYLSKADMETMTPQEIFPYIFVPGLTTAEQLSEVSGRGVGMDIVRDKVQRLKGTITVDSEPNRGTTFTIRLPLTLAVTRALMVVAGNELFAIPMQSVAHIARLDRSQIERLGTAPIVRHNGAACPLLRLSDHLSLREAEDDSPTIPVLILKSGDRQLAVRVEKIVAGRDIVVKSLGTHLQQVDGLIGSTLLGDGTVVPILDPNTVIGADHTAVPKVRKARHGATKPGELTVMVVDDSVSVRRVMENLAKSKGWKPVIAKDGVDALEILQSTDIVPDIFLLDVEMPRMDGYELLSTLRGMPSTRRTPIVMVTSRAGEKHRQKAFALGATDYLAKPYQDEQLTALVISLTVGRESAFA